MKKKMILFFVFCFMIIPVAFSNTTLKDVILTGSTEAEDDFDNRSINTTRWSSGHMNNWSEGSYAISSEHSSGYYAWDRYLYQNYDYNQGAIKSDYYQFEFRSRSYQNNYNRYSGRITFNDEAGKETMDGPVSVWHNSGEYSIKIGSVVETGNFGNHDSAYKFKVILDRIGSTDEFNVTVSVYFYNNYRRSYEYKSSKSGTATLESIYPTLSVDKNTDGLFYYYNAMSMPQGYRDVHVEEMYQDYAYDEKKEKIIVKWAENEKYDNVRFYFSDDPVITSDEVIVTADMDDDKKTLYFQDIMDDLSVNLRQDGYIGIQPYSSNDEGNISKYEYDYLEPVDYFGYVTIVDRMTHKFYWAKVDNATRYEIRNNSDRLKGEATSSPFVNTTTLTTPNVQRVYVYSNGIFGEHESKSAGVYSTKTSVGKITGLESHMGNSSISFNWDAFTDVTEYQLLIENDLGYLSIVADDIENPNHVLSLDNSFIESKYGVIGYIGGSEGGKPTLVSDIITIKNKVKGITHDFDDSNHEIDIEWQAISDATYYKIYVSSNASMTSPDIYPSTGSGFTDAEGSIDFVASPDDKYIQIKAFNATEESDFSDVYAIDMSRNVPVSGVVATYIPNSGIVSLNWNELTNAEEYNVYAGSTEGGVTLVGTSLNESYDYRILEDDPNMIWFAVQGVSASQNFIVSDAVSKTTFSNDVIENITLIKHDTADGVNTNVDLHWSVLPRADKYIIFTSTNSNMLGATSREVNDNTANIVVGATETFFTVKGYYGSVESKTSAVISSNAISNIGINSPNQNNLLNNKFYNQPLEFDVDLEILEDEVYNTMIEIDLDNILANTPAHLIAEFIYPQIVSVSYGQYSDDVYTGVPLDYDLVITSGKEIAGNFEPEGGYKIVIDITEADQETKLLLNKVIKVKLKTDLRFVTEFEDPFKKESILYKASGDYKLMELPFVIENQITNLENELFATYGLSQHITKNLNVDVLMSYKVKEGVNPPTASSARVAQYYPISFSFKSKNAIIGE